MAGLLVKNFPRDLHVRLKARAASRRRSLSNEVLAILEEVLSDRPGAATLAEIDALRVRGAAPLTESLLAEAKAQRRT